MCNAFVRLLDGFYSVLRGFYALSVASKGDRSKMAATRNVGDQQTGTEIERESLSSSDVNGTSFHGSRSINIGVIPAQPDSFIRSIRVRGARADTFLFKSANATETPGSNRLLMSINVWQHNLESVSVTQERDEASVAF